jgi:hypothetical protein
MDRGYHRIELMSDNDEFNKNIYIDRKVLYNEILSHYTDTTNIKKIKYVIDEQFLINRSIAIYEIDIIGTSKQEKEEKILNLEKQKRLEIFNNEIGHCKKDGDSYEEYVIKFDKRKQNNKLKDHEDDYKKEIQQLEKIIEDYEETKKYYNFMYPEQKKKSTLWHRRGK